MSFRPTMLFDFSLWVSLTGWSPPFGILSASWFKTSSQVLTSQIASRNWDQLKFVALMPVRLLLTLAITSTRSSFVRNHAAEGTSGRRNKTTTDPITVADPRMRYNAYLWAIFRSAVRSWFFFADSSAVAYLPSRNHLDVMNPKSHKAADESTDAAPQVPDRLTKGLLVSRIPHGHDNRQPWGERGLRHPQKEAIDQKSSSITTSSCEHRDCPPEKPALQLHTQPHCSAECTSKGGDLQRASDEFCNWKTHHEDRRRVRCREIPEIVNTVCPRVVGVAQVKVFTNAKDRSVRQR